MSTARCHQICKTCRYAAWQRTSAGNIRYRQAGDCTYVAPRPVLPICVDTERLDTALSKSKIWWDEDRPCPTWGERE